MVQGLVMFFVALLLTFLACRLLLSPHGFVVFILVITSPLLLLSPCISAYLHYTCTLLSRPLALVLLVNMSCVIDRQHHTIPDMPRTYTQPYLFLRPALLTHTIYAS